MNREKRMVGQNCLSQSNHCTLTHLYHVYLLSLEVDGHLALHILVLGIKFYLVDNGFIFSKLISWTYSTLHSFYFRKRVKHENVYMIVTCLGWEFLRIPPIHFSGNSVIHHYQNSILSPLFFS